MRGERNGLYFHAAEDGGEKSGLPWRELDPLESVVVRQYIESETAFVKLSTGAGKFSSNLHHNVPSSRARTIEI